MSSASPKVTILIADDDSVFREMLRLYLSRFGFDIIEAENGKVAIDIVEQQKPDLILMDTLMPVMTGIDAAPIIKRNCGDVFIPIIFITALKDEASLSKCLESGGDDLLVKPINWLMLHARILSMLRIRDMHRTLEKYKRNTEIEIELSRHIFTKLTNRMGEKLIPGLEQWIHSAGHFCGDLCLFDKSPSGKLYLMLGDFTGHGLSASVGALPIADMFFDGVRNDNELSSLLAELNNKLHDIMPIGNFCAAVCICSDPATGRTEIVNAGLPPVLILDDEGKLKACVESSHLMLGVLPDPRFNESVTTIYNVENKTLVIHSDGVTEARNSAGEMFGEDRLHIALIGGGSFLESIKKSLQEFMGSQPPDDDISLVTLRL